MAIIRIPETRVRIGDQLVLSVVANTTIYSISKSTHTLLNAETILNKVRQTSQKFHKGIWESRVRIYTRSKGHEIAVPTLNPR